MQPILGTYIEIGSFDICESTEHAITNAFGAVKQIQRLLSFHDSESELSLLNRSNGNEVRLSSTTAKALRLARFMTRMTDGHFNFALGGQLIQDGILPDHDGNTEVNRGNWNDLQIRGTRARLTRSVKICLDGIAKGLAVDLAISELQERLSNGWVNAGGDLRFFGNVDFPVYRRSNRGEPLLLGNFRNCAVATSSTRTKDDPRYRGKVLSAHGLTVVGTWTVKAPSAWLADALTKAAASLPISSGANLVQRLGGELWIDRQVPV